MGCRNQLTFWRGVLGKSLGLLPIKDLPSHPHVLQQKAQLRLALSKCFRRRHWRNMKFRGTPPPLPITQLGGVSDRRGRGHRSGNTFLYEIASSLWESTMYLGGIRRQWHESPASINGLMDGHGVFRPHPLSKNHIRPFLARVPHLHGCHHALHFEVFRADGLEWRAGLS